MKKYLLVLVSLCCALLPALAEHLEYPELKKSDANIIGHVLDKKTSEHLPYITIALKGTTIGTVTDATGHYFLKNLPEGNFMMEVSSVGYKTVTRSVTLKKGKTLEENFELEEDAIALDGVVVSANRSETTRRLAPTLVNVVDLKLFETTNSSTLSQGLNFQPGVRVETNCQNCGFQQVRINGLDGPYTQILIDSRPVFSALSGVYGLEQIPASMIERVEVMRGGGNSKATFVIWEDVSRLFPNINGFVNTEKGTSFVSAAEVEITIPLTIPVDNVSMMKFNPFIFVNNRSHEIHLTDFAPTSKMDTNLLQTADDCSDASRNIYYRMEDMSCWALDFPRTSASDPAWRYPKEKSSVVKAYKNYSKWVINKTDLSWFDSTISENVDEDELY